MDNEYVAHTTTRVTLKTLSSHLGLTPGTISAVLNDSPAALRIPPRTRDRIVTAARRFNYQPNPVARALRTGRSATLCAEKCDVSAPHGAVVLLGAHQFDRALTAIQQAGLRVHDDFSVLDLSDGPGAWDGLAFDSAPHYPALQPAPDPT